jgi:hypothetical protein
MPRLNTANITSTLLALLIACVTMWLSYTRLKHPETILDWVALICSGLTTGIITFFITWGHFQTDPAPEKLEP